MKQEELILKTRSDGFIHTQYKSLVLCCAHRTEAVLGVANVEMMKKKKKKKTKQMRNEKSSREEEDDEQKIKENYSATATTQLRAAQS